VVCVWIVVVVGLLNVNNTMSANDTIIKKIKDVTQSLFLFLIIPTNKETRKRIGKQSKMAAIRFIM